MSKVPPPIISRDAGKCKFEDHRRDFRTCPHCDSEFETEEWEEAIVIVVLAVVNGKHGSFAIISECRDCFKHSWVHNDLVVGQWVFERKFPHITTEIKIEHDKRRIAAARDWGKSLCWQCKHMTNPTIDTHTWRKCVVGTGPAKVECDSFELYQSPKKGKKQ